MFGYDSVGRLTGENRFDRQNQWICDDPMDLLTCSMQPVDVLQGSETFAWDAVGNPTDRGAVTQTGNRLTAYDGWTLAYDSAGYLVSRSKSGMPTQTFTWNGLGQLTSVTTAGSGTVSFGYDGFGRRVRRTAASGAVTQYLYRGDDLLLEMDGSGNLRREYTYYPGIDRPHSVREHASGVAGRYYFTMELPGHVSGLLNASGQMVNEYRYSPFGKPVLVQEGVPNPLRYMAREWDADAGLYYVRNRWYDPEVGRFVSEDPIGLAGGINVYAYAWNDPIRHRDPLGLEPCSDRSFIYFSGPLHGYVFVCVREIAELKLLDIPWRMVGELWDRFGSVGLTMAGGNGRFGGMLSLTPNPVCGTDLTIGFGPGIGFELVLGASASIGVPPAGPGAFVTGGIGNGYVGFGNRDDEFGRRIHEGRFWSQRDCWRRSFRCWSGWGGELDLYSWTKR